MGIVNKMLGLIGFESQDEYEDELIENSERVVFFGGAGVSTESGIPDFRSVDGLYNQKYKFPPEKILSHSFFQKHPEEFYRFYHDKLAVRGILPNITHNYLANLEKEGKLTAVITQNIDGLHTMAGSRSVYELHGSLYRNYCVKCKMKYEIDYILDCENVPVCSCGGIIRPDVVLYEEPLDDDVVAGAVENILDADLLIVAGTSLNVYPAAGLIRYFSGNNMVLINRDRTPFDSYAGMVINCNMGDVFTMLYERKWQK
jgi:NAD-dependent deacetylase